MNPGFDGIVKPWVNNGAIVNTPTLVSGVSLVYQDCSAGDCFRENGMPAGISESFMRNGRPAKVHEVCQKTAVLPKSYNLHRLIDRLIENGGVAKINLSSPARLDGNGGHAKNVTTVKNGRPAKIHSSTTIGRVAKSWQTSPATNIGKRFPNGDIAEWKEPTPSNREAKISGSRSGDPARDDGTQCPIIGEQTTDIGKRRRKAGPC